MFKPFLLLLVCVGLFVFFSAPLLYAGFTPQKSTDLSVQSLKEENPELWQTLGLDALGDDETVLHLTDNADQILLETMQQVISSLPQEQISYEEVIDSLAGDSSTQHAENIERKLAFEGLSKRIRKMDDFSQETVSCSQSPPVEADQTALLPKFAMTMFQYYQEQARWLYTGLRQAVLEPAVHRYHQVRNYVRKASGYCARFLSQYYPSLFYNPLMVAGRGITIDPSVFPARWLQIREIRDHFWQRWIRLNSHHFTSRIRRFDNLQLPAQLRWKNVLIKGFSFQNAVIPYHSFNYCQLVDTNLQGTQFYRCRISCSEISGIQTDLQTQLQTSTFQTCATQNTITTLLAVTGAENTKDSSWQGLVHRMMNIYFVSQLQQHMLLQQLVAAVTTGQVGEFIEHSKELINLYPELFSVALQVMFIVAYQNKEMAQHWPNIQLLMSHHAEDAQILISACNQPDSDNSERSTKVMMREVQWPQTPVMLTSEQLDYQNNLMIYMQQNGLKPVTTPKDDQCFYHVLAQHAAETDESSTNKDKTKRAELLRQMIASYLFVYLTNLYAQDDSSPQLPVDGLMQTKTGFLDTVLSDGLIDLEELLDTAAEAADPFGWAGQTTGMVTGIVLGQPVLMINNHGPNVHVSLMYPDGSSVSGNQAEEALQAGQLYNVIPVVYDSVNHWFTMVGAMFQTWLVLQGHQTKPGM